MSAVSDLRSIKESHEEVVYFFDRALATFLSQLARDYRTQLAEVQQAFREQQPGIASLLGRFSLPAYEGNGGGLGWKLSGFEDRHLFQPPFGDHDRGCLDFVSVSSNSNLKWRTV